MTYVFRMTAPTEPVSTLEFTSSRLGASDVVKLLAHFYRYWFEKGLTPALTIEGGASAEDVGHMHRLIMERVQEVHVAEGLGPWPRPKILGRIAVNAQRLARMAELEAPALILESQFRLVGFALARLRLCDGYDYRALLTPCAYDAQTAAAAVEAEAADDEVETKAMCAWAGVGVAEFEAMAIDQKSELHQRWTGRAQN